MSEVGTMNALIFLILFLLAISLLALILPVGLVIRKTVGVCPVKCLATESHYAPSVIAWQMGIHKESQAPSAPAPEQTQT